MQPRRRSTQSSRKDVRYLRGYFFFLLLPSIDDASSDDAVPPNIFFLPRRGVLGPPPSPFGLLLSLSGYTTTPPPPRLPSASLCFVGPFSPSSHPTSPRLFLGYVLVPSCRAANS